MQSQELGPFEAASFKPRDPRALLQPLLKYKWLVAAVAVAVFALVVAWTVRQPKIYQAVGTIEYDPDPPRPLGQSVEELSTPGTNIFAAHEFFATQNLVIESRGLAEQVVSKLGLHRNADFMGIPEDERAEFRGKQVWEAAERLQDALTVEQVPDTRLVKIRIKDRDPERAALLVNTLIDVYIDKTMSDRLGSTVAALEWLSQQLAALKGQLETSENALYSFKRDNNVLSVSLEDRQNQLAHEMAQLNEELTKARSRRIEIEARVNALRAIPLDDPLFVKAEQLKNDGTLSELRKTYRAKLAEHEAAAVMYGPSHPTIKSSEATLRELRRTLQLGLEEIVGAAETELAAAREVESKLGAALAQANEAGLELNLQEIEYGRLNRERENQAKLYGLVLERTAETDLTRMLKVSFARRVDRALAPTLPVYPRFQLNIVVGLIGGLLLGILLAVLLHVLDRTLKGVADLEQLGVTLLGILPRFEENERGRKAGRRHRATANNDLIVHTHPMSQVAEHCRTIRTNLTFMGVAEPLRTLLLTSASPREGKTTVAASISISIAQSGKRVLLVDTDLRRPRVHRAFGIPSTRGITSVLVNECALSEAIVDSGVPGLSILPCGPIPVNPSELLHTARFRQMIDEAVTMFDQVIFDSPPLGAVTDAAVVAPQVKGVMLIARARETTRDAFSSALRQLRAVSANVVGAVLNEVNASDSSYGYGGYYYYSGYYSSDANVDPPDDKKASMPA